MAERDLSVSGRMHRLNKNASKTDSPKFPGEKCINEALPVDVITFVKVGSNMVAFCQAAHTHGCFFSSPSKAEGPADKSLLLVGLGPVWEDQTGKEAGRH